MKKFLKHVFIFSAFIALFFIGTFFALKNYPVNQNIYSLPENINTLFIGDSHVECAVNDELLTTAINYAESGDNYFYTFIKLRKLIENNPEVKTVFLSYSYFNILEYQNKWYYDDKYINFKVSKYLMEMSNEELIKSFTLNPKEFIASIPTYIKHNALRIVKNKKLPDLEWGGYKSLQNIRRKDMEFTFVDNGNYSALQIHYLSEIYNYCSENNIKLNLIATPIFKWEKQVSLEAKNKYYSLSKQNFINARLLDYTDVVMPDTMFADNEHLNKYGAELFTLETLK